MQGEIKKTPVVLVLWPGCLLGFPGRGELRSFGRMHGNCFNHPRQLRQQLRRELRQRLPRQAVGDESWFHLLCRIRLPARVRLRYGRWIPTQKVLGFC